MEVKEAVRAAKAYVSDLFAEESIINLGLEEVSFDDAAGTWDVTLGFSRPWNTIKNALTAISGDAATRRAYRVVEIRDSDGKVLSVKRQGLPD